MFGRRDASSPSRARPAPAAPSPEPSRGRLSMGGSPSRASSTARLASPIASSSAATPAVRQVPTPKQLNSGIQTPLAGVEGSRSASGPGQSALAAALQGSFEGTPPRFGTPPIRPLSPAAAGVRGSEQQSTYGSFESRSIQGAQNAPGWVFPGPNEDPEVVKRHLVHGSEHERADSITQLGGKSSLFHSRDRETGNTSGLDDGFSSLRLQGGDITRQVYRWTEEAEAQSKRGGLGQRSKSFNISRPMPQSDVLDINSIKVPGGFRRNYLRRTADSPSPLGSGRVSGPDGGGRLLPTQPQPRLFTNNFIEFLTLYGHFAGEALEEDDEVSEIDDYEDGGYFDEGSLEDEDGVPTEGSALITPRALGGRRRKAKERSTTGNNDSFGAVMLLLKSFVGTGVLFLPRAYLNGGMLFSNLVLLGVASLSYYCFILLVKTRLIVEGSFGDIGGVLYGKFMRNLILSSIVLSQIGFVSAYIVFTSENLQAFILAVSKCRTWIDIKFMVLMQLIIFLPLSLIRDISKLGATALVADFFILLGLIYLYYYDILTLVSNHGISDVVNFNSKDWTLFIGTAIFTFEGIGLIIPIQESMKEPLKFPSVLAGVMIIVTVVFISMGALSYAAFGSTTKTVIILNLPQDDKFVNAVQFLYSLAILLSTPLQLFPAIRIMENELFTRSGKNNPYIKWRKNMFRFCLVMLCAAIAWGGAGDLDKFVALVGSFACVPLVYVYPPLLHLKAVAQTRWQRVSDISLCVFGAVVMVYTTTLTIMSWAGGSDAPKAPGYCD